METWMAEQCDVAIIGGGPAGLSAAVRLRELGVERVIVLERETAAGGIPRHCGHPPFGMREFRRCMTGPTYAKALVSGAIEAGAEIRTSTTATGVQPGGVIAMTTASGVGELKAKRILLATGVRETPRSARLISGGRPSGVMTTGTLQSMVYLKRLKPFQRPVIIGTELVSFSALLTCRHAGARPVAMVEQADRVTAWSFSVALPAVLGIPVYRRHRLNRILGGKGVEGVEIVSAEGQTTVVPCDGVILTGQFTPESTLVRMGHLSLDTASGGPSIDVFGRCSDPVFFAAGNLTRPVETAGWCWREGRAVAEAINASLKDELTPLSDMIDLHVQSHPLRFAVPGRIGVVTHPQQLSDVQLRFAEAAEGTLWLRQGERIVWSRRLSALPERRVLVPLSELDTLRSGVSIEIGFDRS